MNDFIKESIFQNLKLFCQDLSDKEMSELNWYLICDFTKEPNKIQKRFYEEFFGEREWLEFVRVAKLKTKPSFTSTFKTTSELTTVRGLFSYFVQQRFEKVLNQIPKNPVKKETSARIKLKRELKNAIEESYFDGIFDKCDGFCNITDVLIEHKLIKPFKQD